MWSVREGLQRFIESLELTPEQQKAVTEQHTRVRESLRQRLGSTDFLSGSYGRNTAIRPLHDIDIFVVMGGEVSSTPLGLTPDTALKEIRQALHETWPDKKLPILQWHSVHIDFSTPGFQFDVVPAFKVSGRDAYLIPERRTEQTPERWILTNPRLHQKRSTDANNASGGALNPLIKAVKHWNRRHESSPLRSFHLEAMSYSAFSSAPGDYLTGLEKLFTHLSQQVQCECPDPAGLGSNVDARMSSNQRMTAHQVLVSAAEEVRLARMESTTNPASAHARLRKLFGEFYRDS